MSLRGQGSRGQRRWRPPRCMRRAGRWTTWLSVMSTCTSAPGHASAHERSQGVDDPSRRRATYRLVDNPDSRLSRPCRSNPKIRSPRPIGAPMVAAAQAAQAAVAAAPAEIATGIATGTAVAAAAAVEVVVVPVEVAAEAAATAAGPTATVAGAGEGEVEASPDPAVDRRIEIA